VVEHPCRALPLDAAKIDQDYLPARSQRPAAGSERQSGKIRRLIDKHKFVEIE
jgi:hypothetical protein